MKDLSYLQKVILITTISHFLLVATAFFYKPSIKNSQPKAILVRTIAEHKPQVVKTNQTPKVPQEPKKQATKPTQAKSKPASKPKQIAVAKNDKKEPLKKEKESPSTKKNDLDIDSLVVPSLKPTELKSKKELPQVTVNEILEYIQNIVILPKKAFLKVKLHIHPDLYIEKVEIIDSTDEDNSRYIQETLNSLSLKMFNFPANEKELVISFQGI